MSPARSRGRRFADTLDLRLIRDPPPHLSRLAMAALATSGGQSNGRGPGRRGGNGRSRIFLQRTCFGREMPELVPPRHGFLPLARSWPAETWSQAVEERLEPGGAGRGRAGMRVGIVTFGHVSWTVHGTWLREPCLCVEFAMGAPGSPPADRRSRAAARARSCRPRRRASRTSTDPVRSAKAPRSARRTTPSPPA